MYTADYLLATELPAFQLAVPEIATESTFSASVWRFR